MKQKDILEGAAEILGLHESNFSILRRCANLVLSNIAANYRHCVIGQEFNVTDRKIEYKDFMFTFLGVKHVWLNGADAPYSPFIDFLQVPNGKVQVIYYYVPAFTEDLEQYIYVPNLSKETLIYGIITEYAIISGMFNEAKVWNERFEAGLFGKSPRNKRVRIPAERW